MGVRGRLYPVTVLLAGALALLWGCARHEPAMRVRRETFRDHLLLTGELRAVRSVDIMVPRLPQWRTQIRWMERDGCVVKKGQKVLDLDFTALAGELEDKKLAEASAAAALAKQKALNASGLEEAKTAREQAETALQKAEIEARVPAELFSRRDYQARQLALAQAKATAEKAGNDLAAAEKGQEADLGVARLALDKARRDLAAAREAMGKMTVLAPCDGVLDVAQHPWEGRKLQVGDVVFVGWTVLRIPDMSRVEVAARLFDVDEGKVLPGMPATCRLDAFPKVALRGRVASVSSIAQEVPNSPTRRAFAVIVSLEHSDPERMRPGMSVQVSVETQRIPDALVAPRAALDLSVNPPEAHLAGGGVAAVTLGPCSARECVVTSGLREGERLASAYGSAR